jgi:hypothetical protein
MVLSGGCRPRDVKPGAVYADAIVRAINEASSHQGLVGIAMTGGPPVTGRYILPPSGIPITGAPPVTGMIMRGPMF